MTKFPNGIDKGILALYTDPGIVYVEGMAINPFGHALLRFDRQGVGGYMHIHEPGWSYPSYVTDEEFDAEYNKKANKRILAEQNVRVPDIELARKVLNQYAQQQFFWGGSHHNCLSWCIHLLEASGADLKDFKNKGWTDLPANRIQDILAKDENQYSITSATKWNEYIGDDDL